MPGNMSKEDAPSRGASLTFTIDNILNLKQQDSEDLEVSKGQRDSGCKSDFRARCEEEWDVRGRHDSGSEETGNSGKFIWSLQSTLSKATAIFL